MATIPQALAQIRRARRAEAPPQTRYFETYKPQYTEILSTLESLGGETLVDELTDWLVEQTTDTGRLPEPAAVRQQAHQLCADRGLSIPVDSAATLADRMVPFEPYTAAELAADLELQIEEAEAYLKTLEAEQVVQSKKPPNTKRLWLREPKPQACPNCGREFEIKYLHAIFGSAQFCPRCGTHL